MSCQTLSAITIDYDLKGYQKLCYGVVMWNSVEKIDISPLDKYPRVDVFLIGPDYDHPIDQAPIPTNLMVGIHATRSHTAPTNRRYMIWSQDLTFIKDRRIPGNTEVGIIRASDGRVPPPGIPFDPPIFTIMLDKPLA